MKEKLKDFGVFILYLLNPNGLVEDIKKEAVGLKKQFIGLFKPKKLSIVVFLIGFYLFLRLQYPTNKNIFLLFLIISVVINLIPAYRGGEHRHWDKKRKMERLKGGKNNTN